MIVTVVQAGGKRPPERWLNWKGSHGQGDITRKEFLQLGEWLQKEAKEE